MYRRFPLGIRVFLRRLQTSWESLISNTLGEDNLLTDLVQISGPLAIGCGLLLLMCLIFTLRYRSRKKWCAGMLSILTGVGSGLLALLWASCWCNYDRLEIIPVTLVFLVLLILLIVCIRTAAAKHVEKRKEREARYAEKRKEREARYATMTKQKEIGREVQKARRAEQIEMVKKTADKLSSQAKESIGQLTAATKKILADSNQVIAAPITAEPVTGAIELDDIYVVNQGRDPHALQKIRSLYALHQEDIITKEEYTAKVAQLMERL
nr:hypothetical protein [Clostridia bacterium]